MKKFCLAYLLFLFALLAQAQTVVSVRATDSGKRSSQIVIQLSEAVNPDFRSSGTNVSLQFPGAKLSGSAAQYSRLSHVIDTISLSEDNLVSTVNIRTMGTYQVSHRVEDRRVIIDIVNPQIAETTAPRPAEPKPVPKVVSSPAPTESTEPSLQQFEEPSPDSLYTVPPALISPPVTPPLSFMDNLTQVVEDNLLSYIVIWAFCIILIVILYIHLFFISGCSRDRQPKLKPENASKPLKERKIKTPKTPKQERRLDLGLDGATLIMDSDTKLRMVTKLLEEGWNSKQIAREMKISLKEIEEIIKRAQFTSH